MSAPVTTPHCETCRCGERFPVQGGVEVGGFRRAPGTIAMWEAEQAYAAYAARYGTSQSLARLGERSGFGFEEVTELLGHEPTTWRVRTGSAP